MIKKVIQQGRSDFDARSVLPVREHDKIARTPLVAFFNIPTIAMTPLATPQASTVEPESEALIQKSTEIIPQFGAFL